eukprot:CAMPEP_0178452166 /NCGR_PEP_ID=MMETSP0689_2-20121128/44088_1 /TAXON_ID=160604 /ORGANISM="Amphidinium massartii, Strain CS-259" /LENGTH=369 /DNA_ID=CAMNT_0020077831 /DNA_START=86 /DNA_END=1193 /DNA_ORIENTATION=-
MIGPVTWRMLILTLTTATFLPVAFSHQPLALEKDQKRSDDHTELVAAVAAQCMSVVGSGGHDCPDKPHLELLQKRASMMHAEGSDAAGDAVQDEFEEEEEEEEDYEEAYEEEYEEEEDAEEEDEAEEEHEQEEARGVNETELQLLDAGVSGKVQKGLYVQFMDISSHEPELLSDIPQYFKWGQWAAKLCQIDKKVLYKAQKPGKPWKPLKSDYFKSKNMHEEFGAWWMGDLVVEKGGEYTFVLWSGGGGSQLLLNGAVVVDNDGIHENKKEEATITLQSGHHPIQVKYFLAEGEIGSIKLQWKGPDSKQKVKTVPAKALRPCDGCMDSYYCTRAKMHEDDFDMPPTGAVAHVSEEEPTAAATMGTAEAA